MTAGEPTRQTATPHPRPRLSVAQTGWAARQSSRPHNEVCPHCGSTLAGRTAARCRRCDPSPTDDSRWTI